MMIVIEARTPRSNATAAGSAVLVLAFSLALSACAPVPGGGRGYPPPPLGAGRTAPLSATSSLLDRTAEGVEFDDGWLLEWGAGSAELRSHFASFTIDCAAGRSSAVETACVLPAQLLPEPYDEANGFANFYQDRLFCVWLFFDRARFPSLQQALEQVAGEPEASSAGVKRWSSGDVMVDLLPDQESDSSGLLVLTYKPIMKIMADNLHKAQSRKDSP